MIINLLSIVKSNYENVLGARPGGAKYAVCFKKNLITSFFVASQTHTHTLTA